MKRERTELKIEDTEFAERLRRLQACVRDADLDVFIVSAFDSIFYLTGAGFEPLERPFFLLVRPDGPPTLIVPLLDREHMSKASGIRPGDFRTYREYPAPRGEGWADCLNDSLANAKRIGVEPTLSQEIADVLQERSPRTIGLVEALRRVKSEMEIRLIRRAADFADRGVGLLLKSSYEGATIAEGFAQTRNLNAAVIREVSDWDPVTTKVLMATWAAPRSAMPHSIPKLGDRLGAGPHVALVLTRINGYAAESERTFFTQPPTAEMREAFDAMMEARRIAFDMIRPGVRGGEIDARVNEFLGRAGYSRPEQRLHRTGHGIGLGNHEAPWLAEGCDERLEENMVVSVEPGIYLKDVGGFRHSDTVLVTRDGHERLTRFAEEMEELTLRRWKPLQRMIGRILRNRLAIR